MQTTNKMSVKRLPSLIISLLLPLASLHAQIEKLASPNGRIQLRFAIEEGRPLWQVTSAGAPLLERGVLGLELTSDTFREPFALERVERATGDSTWHPVWGNLSTVRDHYNELVLTLRETREAGRCFQIVLRTYDEGIACRYAVPAQPCLERVAIKRLLTEYRFTGNRPVYQCRNYEYGTVGVNTMSKSEGCVTVGVGDGRYVALTDADRADFSQVSWERKKDVPNTIIGTLHSMAEGQAPFRTSWQVMIVGDTASALYENRFIVENLSPPCAVADTSWIRPGEAICQVRNTRMVTDELKKLVVFASAHNIEYVEIDHSWCGAETKWTPEEIAFFEKSKSKFWDDKPEWRKNVGGNLLDAAKGWVPFRPKADSGGNYVDLDLPALTAYGKSLNPPVGVCLYVRGVVLKEFGGEHPIDAVFATYERWGVAGVKPGFVPPASQQNERAIAYMLKKAAEHKLIAVIHDAYYPSGLSRTYPNLMNVEGVAGEEAEPSIKPELKSLHDVMLPFTRGLMGPFDYTPEIYKTSKTQCHQVAMLGVYHGRPSIRGGMKQWSPGGVGGGEIEFVEKLPGLFDEMKVITELGHYVTVARRKGGAWFVASMGDGLARSCPLPLDFLKPDADYRASIYSDKPGQLTASHAQMTVTSRTIVPIAMEPNGGHLMIIEPFTQPPVR